MKEVSEFEAQLLRILRCLMHKAPVQHSLGRLVNSNRKPRCLSRNCVELIQDMLSKGVTEWLARSGWEHQRCVKNEVVVNDRLWNRHSLDAVRLSFTPNSLRFLIWLTADNVAQPRTNPGIDEDTISTGDQLLFLMAYAVLRSTIAGPALLKQPGLRDHGLIHLMFPADVASAQNNPPPDLDHWCAADQAWVSEALQSRLALQWTRSEQAHWTSNNDADVLLAGRATENVLENWFRATEASGRRDLCLFLLKAGRRLMDSPDRDQWFQRFDLRQLQMADRTRFYDAALSFWMSAERLRQWTLQAQAVGFYDDDYQASQLWKREWETLDGDRFVREAQAIIKRFHPMPTTTTGP